MSYVKLQRINKNNEIISNLKQRFNSERPNIFTKKLKRLFITWNY